MRNFREMVMKFDFINARIIFIKIALKILNFLWLALLGVVVSTGVEEIVTAVGAPAAIPDVIAAVASIYIVVLAWKYPLLSFLREGERKTKLKIPEEHQETLNKLSYVSLWRNNSLILYSDTTHDDIMSKLHSLEGSKQGITGFVRAGMRNIVIKGKKIEIPAYFLDHLEGNDRSFYMRNDCLVIK